MISDVEVMNATSFCQPGNGRNTIIPTANANTTLTHGTPRLSSLENDFGMYPLRPSAYEIRALEPE